MPRPKLFIVPKDKSLPNNLPVEPSRLIGREHDVEAALHLFGEQDVRLLTLVGPGGVGKTRLALRMAEDLLAEAQCDVYLIELASIFSPDLVAPAIARTLGVRETPGTPVLVNLKQYLQDKSILLVLDNFEQLIPAGQLVADLLSSCRDLKLIITSRSALHLRGEHLFTVAPLALPDPDQAIGADALSQYGAIALFSERARGVKSDFRLTDTNAATIGEICRRVDGIPLGIELVAAYSAFLTPQSLLARLKHPLHLLTGGALDAPERQQTMRDTIEWSYNLLDKDEQRVFRGLGVFVGGFALRAAEAVCNSAGDIGLAEDHPASIDVLKGLKSLVDKNLVRHMTPIDSDDSRLSMLETVREYAGEQLEREGESDKLHRLYVDYFSGLAADAAPHLKVQGWMTWVEKLGMDQSNFTATLEWLLSRSDPASSEQALHILVDLWLFWLRRSQRSQYRTWLEKALGQTKQEAGLVRITALIRLSQQVLAERDYPLALQWLQQALDSATALGAREEMAGALSMMAAVATYQGNYDGARSLFEQTLVIYRELGTEGKIADTLNNLGEVARYQEDYKRAEAYYKESLSIFRSRGAETDTLVPLINTGHVAYHLGNYGEAKSLFLEAMPLSIKTDTPKGFAEACIGLCTVILAEMVPSAKLSTPNMNSMRLTATLGGFVSALLTQRNHRLDPLDQADFECNAAKSREGLGDRLYEAAREEGKLMTQEQAFALASSEQISEATGSRGRKSVKAPGGLTGREYEVAHLVSQGMTNKDVARQLTLSERTVEMHISHVLGKLGLTTRTELAGWTLRNALPSNTEQN